MCSSTMSLSQPRPHPRFAWAQQRIQLGGANTSWYLFFERCVDRLQGALADAHCCSCRQRPEGGP